MHVLCMLELRRIGRLSPQPKPQPRVGARFRTRSVRHEA